MSGEGLTCELCGDFPTELRARCHPTAPLRVHFESSHMIVLRCYVPTCSREVARLVATPFGWGQAVKLSGPPPADLPEGLSGLAATETPVQPCPICRQTLNAVQGNRKPAPGNKTVCGHCGGFLEFTADLTLRELTIEDVAALDDDTRSLMVRARNAIGKR